MILFLVFVMLNHVSNHWPWVNMMVAYNFSYFENRFEIDKFLKLIDFNTLVILPWKTHDKNLQIFTIRFSAICMVCIIKHRFVSCHTLYFLSMIFVWGWQYSYISRITHYNTKHRIYTSMITKLTKMIMISIREHLQ